MTQHKKFWLDGPPVTTDLFSHIVANRKFENLDTWLVPRWPDGLHDPFSLPDMQVAAKRMWQAVKQNEVIGIVGDYDMDGTPAAALLAQFLKLLGARCEVVLPTRLEGYGFAQEFVTRLIDRKVSLIVTADCGIRDHASVDFARASNVDVIVTDHHECPDALPQAVAVVNPKRIDSTYPFRDLCGTGVIFKLIQAMVSSSPSEYSQKIPKEWLAWSLDLVALATIGDMVSLVDENRLFVVYGLKVLQRGSRKGLRRFADAIDCPLASLQYRDIAFKIIPKLNASGRMDSMQDVFTLLTSDNSAEIDAAIHSILVKQTQSHIILERMLIEARSQAKLLEGSSLILVHDPSWHPGLTGIVAGRLASEFDMPALVLAGTDLGEYRGSGRSVSGVDLASVVQTVAEHTKRFGGHKEAVGLSVEEGSLADFKTHILNASFTRDAGDSRSVDGQIHPGVTQLEHLEKLATLAPWGMGNPEPVWSMSGVTPSQIRWMGQDKHAKILFAEFPQLEVMLFDAKPHQPILDAPVDVCGTLSVNEFRGRKTPQLTLKGIVPHTGEVSNG